MLIRIDKNDVDRWTREISFKSVIIKLLHGHLRPVRDWIWKRFFPRFWKRLEARINEQLKKLYDNVDKYLAHRDFIPFSNPLDNIYSSPPIVPEIREREFRRSFALDRLPVVLGSPNDKLEFVDIKPGPKYIWQKIIEERGLKYQQQRFLNSEAFRDYIEFIKDEICVATGMSKEDLFDGAKLVFPSPLESWQVEYMQNPVPAPNQVTHNEDILKLLEPMTVEKNGVSMLWNDYLKKRREDYSIAKKKEMMRVAQNIYFSKKASRQKKLFYRTCFEPTCNQDLNFSGFISANKPKTSKAYRTLKKLWFAEYKSKKISKISLQFYCCDCSKNNSLRLKL